MAVENASKRGRRVDRSQTETRQHERGGEEETKTAHDRISSLITASELLAHEGSKGYSK